MKKQKVTSMLYDFCYEKRKITCMIYDMVYETIGIFLLRKLFKLTLIHRLIARLMFGFY